MYIGIMIFVFHLRTVNRYRGEVIVRIVSRNVDLIYRVYSEDGDDEDARAWTIDIGSVDLRLAETPFQWESFDASSPL